MKTLVTGGAGFIGSHMTERLLAEGHEVLVLDNFSTGRKENLAHISNNKKLQVISCDIRKPVEALLPYFSKVDWVFHYAALADIVPSIVHPEEYLSTNVDGTMHVVECSRKSGVKRFLYAASTSCYGIPDTFPTPETAAIAPQYPYALSKWLGEEIVMHWNAVYSLPVVSLRLFNVYGPRSRTTGTYGAVFGVFLAQKLAGKPYTIVGDGTQSRDFTFVSDVVDAFYTAATSSVSGERINIGTGKPTDVNTIVALLGGPSVFIPKRPGEPDITQSDTRKAKKLLNWQAKVPISKGIAELVKNIDYWKNAPVWTPESIKDATKEWFTYLK